MKPDTRVHAGQRCVDSEVMGILLPGASQSLSLSLTQTGLADLSLCKLLMEAPSSQAPDQPLYTTQRWEIPGPWILRDN